MYQAVTGRVPFEATTFAQLLFKIVFDHSSRRVLGLHVVSRNAGDIVQGLSIGLRLGATVDELAAMHHIFPTFGEGVKAAAERAA